MEINPEDLRVLLVTGSKCTNKDHIIFNYDDLSVPCFISKLFKELDNIKEENILLASSQHG